MFPSALTGRIHSTKWNEVTHVPSNCSKSKNFSCQRLIHCFCSSVHSICHMFFCDTVCHSVGTVSFPILWAVQKEVVSVIISWNNDSFILSFSAQNETDVNLYHCLVSILFYLPNLQNTVHEGLVDYWTWKEAGVTVFNAVS